MNVLFVVLMLILLAAFVVSNVVAIFIGKPNRQRTARAHPWLQRSTTAQLALMAWLFWLIGAVGTPIEWYSLAIALGVTISFFADLIMGELIKLPGRLFFGIAIFSLAHILYTAGILVGASTFAPAAAEPGGLLTTFVLLVVVAIGFVIWYRFVFNPNISRVKNYGALFYTVVISVMVGAAISVALANPSMWLLAVGALFFLISDVILGNQEFQNNNWRWVKEWIWITYILGQAGIVWSNFFAMQAL